MKPSFDAIWKLSAIIFLFTGSVFLSLVGFETKFKRQTPQIQYEMSVDDEELDVYASGSESGRDVRYIIDYIPRGVGPQRHFSFSGCQQRCAMTSHVELADVVMFNAVWIRNKILPARLPGQIWLVYTREPPTNKHLQGLQRPEFKGQFNWTNTVLGDSTFPVSYGAVKPRQQPGEKNYDRIYNSKRHLVAWFVSQCDRQSRRLDYVHQMMSEVSVHIFGRCGNMTCGSTGYQMGGKKEECLDMLSRQYMFYLSFENSICRDYVTEKTYNMYNNIDVITVVRGGANYTKLLPAGTYIDAAHFPSARELAIYLRDLAADKEKYITMLKRKNKFTSSGDGRDFQCTLCEAAHLRQPRNVYSDISWWFSKQRNCVDPTDL